MDRDSSVLLGMNARDPVHAHEWRVVAVDYEDFLSCTELRCSSCNATSYAP
jgi:hypothetical protein